MNEDIIISVKNLTKDYGKNRGVFDISFDIYSLVQLLVWPRDQPPTSGA